MRTILVSITLFAAVPAVSAPAHEPVAVLSVASVARVLEDVDQISEYSERPALARFIRSLISIGNELKGIERDKPLRVEILFPEEPGPQPRFRIVIPITSEEQVRETIYRVGLELSDEGGELRLRKRGGTGDKPPYVVFRDNCLLIAPELESLLPELLPVENQQKSDLAFRFDAGRVPRGIKQALLKKLHADVANDRKRIEGGSETEQAIRNELLSLGERAVELGVEELESIELNLDLLPASERTDGPGITLHAKWNTLAGGALSRQVQDLAASQRYFAVSADPPAAASLHVSGSIPPCFQPLLEMAVAAGQHAARDELENATVRQRSAVMGIFDLISRTFEDQHAEAIVEFVPAEERMVLLAGVYTAEGQESAEALHVLLPEVQKSDEVDSLQMGVASINGVEFHRLRGNHLKPSDVRLYGPQTAAYLGAGSNELWIALGEPPTLDILPQCVGSRPRDVRANELASFTLHVRPWLHLLGENAKERQIVDVLRQNFPDGTPDSISASVVLDNHGLSAQVELDKPYLKLLSTFITSRVGR